MPTIGRITQFLRGIQGSSGLKQNQPTPGGTYYPSFGAGTLDLKGLAGGGSGSPIPRLQPGGGSQGPQVRIAPIGSPYSADCRGRVNSFFYSLIPFVTSEQQLSGLMQAAAQLMQECLAEDEMEKKLRHAQIKKQLDILEGHNVGFG